MNRLGRMRVSAQPILDARGALDAVNAELARHGHPPVTLPDDQMQRAYLSLQAFAVGAGISLEDAARETALYQIRSLDLARRQ